MRWTVLLVLFCTVALTSCSDEGRGILHPNAPLVVYQRSGGFAPVVESLVLRGSGKAVVRTGPPANASSVSFTLSRSGLVALRRLLRNAELDSIPTAPTSGCSDCYVYVISHGGHRVYTDEATASGSLARLISRLNVIVSAHA